MREDFDTDNESGLAVELLVQAEVDLAKRQGPDGSDAIRVAYIGYEQGSHRVTKVHHLPATCTSATLSYDVRFDEAFQFVKGGKLHGFGPLIPVTGGQKAKPENWSARLVFKEDGRLASYLYGQDPGKKYRRVYSSPKHVFVPGRWHHVVYQVHLNDPGQANGWTRVLVDGREILETSQNFLRGVGGERSDIRTFLFSTFHGGASVDWAPVDSEGNLTTVYAYFDNFVVTEGIHDSNP